MKHKHCCCEINKEDLIGDIKDIAFRISIIKKCYFHISEYKKYMTFITLENIINQIKSHNFCCHCCFKRITKYIKLKNICKCRYNIKLEDICRNAVIISLIDDHRFYHLSTRNIHNILDKLSEVYYEITGLK